MEEKEKIDKIETAFAEGVSLMMEKWDEKNPEAPKEERILQEKKYESDGDALFSIIETFFPKEDSDYHKKIFEKVS